MNGSFLNNTSRCFTDAAADLLASGYGLRFRATGRSMYPAIAEGEIITVERIAADDVRLGDILLVRVQKSVIAHRVEKIGRELNRVTFLLLRGDAAEYCDEPVVPEQVLGRVVAVYRQGRRINVAGRRFRLLRRIRTYASRIRGTFRLLSSRHAA
jgi:signal peptidase I